MVLVDQSQMLLFLSQRNVFGPSGYRAYLVAADASAKARFMEASRIGSSWSSWLLVEVMVLVRVQHVYNGLREPFWFEISSLMRPPLPHL